MYTIIISNIGTMFSGSLELAQTCFGIYVGYSKADAGIASGETVTLMCDDYIIEEYNPPAPPHYHAMNGSCGCMPDSNETYDSVEAAVEWLLYLFEESVSEAEYEELASDLRECGYHSFADPCESGAQYAQVTECTDDYEDCDY